MRTKGRRKGGKKEADPFLFPSTGRVSSSVGRRRRLKRKGAKKRFSSSSSFLGLPSFSRSFCGDPYCKQKKRSRPRLKQGSAKEKKRKTFTFPSSSPRTKNENGGGERWGEDDDGNMPRGEGGRDMRAFCTFLAGKNQDTHVSEALY